MSSMTTSHAVLKRVGEGDSVDTVRLLLISEVSSSRAFMVPERFDAVNASILTAPAASLILFITLVRGQRAASRFPPG